MLLEPGHEILECAYFVKIDIILSKVILKQYMVSVKTDYIWSISFEMLTVGFFNIRGIIIELSSRKFNYINYDVIELIEEVDEIRLDE